MSKRYWNDPTPEYQHEAMVDAIRCRREERGEPKKFTAPGNEQRWRARDLVDIHWNLTGIETPSASYNRIMSCIIGHANPHTGRCQMKQKLIAAETGYSRDTVKRAVKWWVAMKFLEVEPIGLGRSNAYHPQWDVFEMFYVAIAKDIEAQKEAWRSPVVHQGAPQGVQQGAPREVHHAAPHESQSRISKDESHHIEYAPPSVGAHSIKRKEGFQGKTVAGNQSPPDKYGPIYWGQRVVELEVAVVAAKTEVERAELDKKLALARVNLAMLKARGA